MVIASEPWEGDYCISLWDRRVGLAPRFKHLLLYPWLTRFPIMRTTTKLLMAVHLQENHAVMYCSLGQFPDREICKHLCVQCSCQTLGCFQVVYIFGSLNMLKYIYNSIKLNVVFIYSTSVYWTLTMYLEDTRHCLYPLSTHVSTVETNNWWSDKNHHGRSIENYGLTSGAHGTQISIWWVLETG